MKNIKLMMLGTVAVLGFSAPAAMAGEKSYTSYNAAASGISRSVAMQNYFNYEEREPCQNYRQPPAGFYFDGCNLMKVRPKVVAQAEPMAKSVAKVEPAAGNEMAVYKINFDYDKSSINPSDKEMMDWIAYEIKQTNPRKVTVTGYTDTAGTFVYNEKLSQRRANSVYSALNYRGINPRIIDRQAYGENNLAVETNDGVRLRDNRRAVVEFVK